MSETSLEASPETKNPVPAEQRAALEALRQRVQPHNAPAAEKLSAVDERETVLQGLRELARDIEAGRITDIPKADVDAVHDAIEAPIGFSTRAAEEKVEEVVGSGFDAVRGMNPEVKKAIAATAIVGGGALGLFGLSKLWKGTKKVALAAWDTTLDVGEKAVKTTGSILKWLFKTAAVAGVGALTLLGIQRLTSPAASTPGPTVDPTEVQ